MRSVKKMEVLFFVVLMVVMLGGGIGIYQLNIQSSWGPDYNTFRLAYSDVFEYLEINWESLVANKQQEPLKQLLDTTEGQLLLYDLKSNTITFNTITQLTIGKEQLEGYLVHDQGIMTQLKDHYLISHILFKSGKPVGIALFIVENAWIFNEKTVQLQTLVKILFGIGILILCIVGIFIVMIHFKMNLPIQALERETKIIARGRFNEPIDSKLQSGVLNGCFYELDKMRQDLKDMATQNAQFEQGRKELINYLTHDLRTPIASIRALTEGLIDGIPKNEQSKDNYLKGILQKTEEMDRLTTDLFHHANISLAGFKIEPKEIYFDKMMDNMLLSLKSLFQTYEGEVQYEIVTPHVLINVDTYRMEQAIINLAVNAMKYSPNKGLIKIFTSYHGDYLTIGVEDIGMGISKEDLPFIFDQFYRGEKSRSREYGGTGLGLSIVKYIVEAHEGYVSVKSQIGEGTVFKLMLPKV